MVFMNRKPFDVDLGASGRKREEILQCDALVGSKRLCSWIEHQLFDAGSFIGSTKQGRANDRQCRDVLADSRAIGFGSIKTELDGLRRDSGRAPEKGEAATSD
jgi:hypothetical protein